MAAHHVMLESLDVLDKYKSVLASKAEEIDKIYTDICRYHDELADNGQWRDIKHQEFKEDFLMDFGVQLKKASNDLNDKIIGRVRKLKSIYADMGVQ